MIFRLNWLLFIQIERRKVTACRGWANWENAAIFKPFHNIMNSEAFFEYSVNSMGKFKP
jgi:hypothetical protein